jgi:hypothetical protein
VGFFFIFFFFDTKSYKLFVLICLFFNLLKIILYLREELKEILIKTDNFKRSNNLVFKMYISSVVCCHCHIPLRLAATFDGVGSDVVAGRPDSDQHA